jgi:CobQ/CobB/MinD/ParA nucleotide binding domain
MPKRIDFIMNGKGGVGKSFFATHFAQALKDHSMQPYLIDTDCTNSTLKRFHAEADFVDLAKPKHIDGIFEALQKQRLIIVDGRAASTDYLLEYFAEIVLTDTLRMFNAELTLILPIHSEADSVEQLRLITSSLGKTVKYVIVKNQSHSERFDIYDESQTRVRLLNELSACEITMPRMHDWLVAMLNKHGVTTTGAQKHDAFTLLDRQRLKHWQRQFCEQITLAKHLLLPSAEPQRSS